MGLSAGIQGNPEMQVTFRKGDLNEAAGAADASRARKWRECRDRDIVVP